MTKVIIRADDITGTSLRRLAGWMDDRGFSIPIAAFALSTQREWEPDDWEYASELITEGWEIGGHTRNHPMLSLLSRSEINTAITENVNDIEAGLERAGLSYTVKSFAYPCGEYDDRVLDILKDSSLECGLTYPDGFPYSSVQSIPSGEERYRWGISNNAYFDLEVWNNRFDRIDRSDGLYVLCLHPKWWWNEADEESVDPRIEWASEEWEKLDAHLSHLQEAGATFTTYRKCI